MRNVRTNNSPVRFLRIWAWQPLVREAAPSTLVACRPSLASGHVDISSLADRDSILTVDKNCQRHFSQIAPSKPRMAPDSSKESAAATFTPKRLTTRGTGQAGTQRAAEHGSIRPYP